MRNVRPRVPRAEIGSSVRPRGQERYLSEDARQIRRSSRSVGLYVGAASALIVILGVGVLVAIILLASRRAGEEHGGAIGSGRLQDDFVVDIAVVLPTVVALGAIGVAMLGFVAWFAAHRSVQPLGEALRRQRNFVADASHELRTPLTTLTSRIQLLQRRHQRGEPLEDVIAELRHDATTMSEVLNDLLVSAEAGQPARTETTIVADAATAAVRSVAGLAEAASVRLTIDADEQAAVALRQVTLVRIIVALLDNAIQHSPSNTTVSVRVGREGRFAAIRVADQGNGITGIAADRVFDRFARSAESGRQRGFGLGLSLVREVAVGVGGSVAVEHTSPTGTTFRLMLPLASDFEANGVPVEQVPGRAHCPDAAGHGHSVRQRRLFSRIFEPPTRF